MTRISILLAGAMALNVASILSTSAMANGSASVLLTKSNVLTSAVNPYAAEAAGPAASTGSPGATHARSMAATCYACHGTDGKSHSAIPPLAGMEKDYFVQQMKDFKSGKREATVMHQHAKGYTDEEFQQMAEVFAAIKP